MIRAFFQPTEIEEALRLGRELGDSAAFLAGGTELNAGYASPPPNLISLARLDLGGIEKRAGLLAVPATHTIQRILDAPGIPPVLAKACRNIVNRNVRNMATIGGHIACRKSCSDIIPALVALQASMEMTLVATGEEKSCPVMEFVESALPGALIRRVLVPDESGRGVAIESYTRSGNDMSIITVAASIGFQEDKVERPILVVGGVAKSAVRLEDLESSIDGGPLPPLEEIEERVKESVSPISDLRGSAELKRHLAGVLMARALGRAAKAKEGGER